MIFALTGKNAGMHHHGPALEADFGAPRLIAAAVWAVGVVVGLSAWLTGHAAVAIVALLMAVAAPWFGLVWVSRGDLPADGPEAVPCAPPPVGLLR